MPRKPKPASLKIALPINEAKEFKANGLKWEIEIDSKLFTVILLPPEGVKIGKIEFEVT